MTKPTKAIVGAISAALVAGLGSLATALSDGTVTPLEWCIVATAVLVGSGLTGAGVYQTTNAPVAE